MTTPNHFQIYRSNTPYAIDCGRAHVAAWRHWRFVQSMRNMQPGWWR